MTLLLAVLLGLSAGVQDGPDYSGVWSLDRHLSDPPTSGPEVTLQVTQTADAVSIRREGATSTSATLFFDGRPPTTSGDPVPPMAGYAAAAAKAEWQGTNLVIEGKRPGGESSLPTSLREVWRLDEEGGLLKIERTFDNGSTEFWMTEVFKKVSD